MIQISTELQTCVICGQKMLTVKAIGGHSAPKVMWVWHRVLGADPIGPFLIDDASYVRRLETSTEDLSLASSSSSSSFQSLML